MRSTQFDPTAAAVVADPYPFFAEERRLGGVAWHEPTSSYLTFDHACANAVLRDRRLGRIWSDRQPADRLEPFNLLHRNQMMENEPPVHTRLRRLVVGAFNRGHVERLRPRVRELAAELLAEVDPAGFDVVGEYAEPLPVLVIAELLGVPTELAPRLRAWSQAIVRMYEVAPSEAVVDAAVAAAEEFADTIRAIARDRARGAARRPGLRPGRGAGRRLPAADGGRGRRLRGAAAQRRPRGLGQRLRQRAGRDAAGRCPPHGRDRCRPAWRRCCASTPRCSCSSGRRPSR